MRGFTTKEEISKWSIEECESFLASSQNEEFKKNAQQRLEELRRSQPDPMPTPQPDPLPKPSHLYTIITILLVLFAIGFAGIAYMNYKHIIEREQLQTYNDSIVKEIIHGPANVREQPNDTAEVVGSIKNGMVAEVSHAEGDWWKIHKVYNPKGGKNFDKFVGYYTHKVNFQSTHLLDETEVDALDNDTLYCESNVRIVRINGPANVREQPNDTAEVVGSIKNGMKAKVSHAKGTWWKIHKVYNPKGGKKFDKFVGYYTHADNIDF